MYGNATGGTVCVIRAGPGVVVSTAAFHARVRGSFPGFGSLKETQIFLPHPRVKLSIVGSLCDREVACSASDHQWTIFESCVWRTVSSHSSHHPQEVLLAQFSLYVHKGGLKADSFHFCLLVHGPDPEKAIFREFVAPPLQLWFDGSSRFLGHIGQHSLVVSCKTWAVILTTAFC